MGANRKEKGAKRRSSGGGKGGETSQSNATGLGPVADACAHIVDELLKKEDAYSFSEPVTKLWSLEELPNYFYVVKEPMDLGTIMTKIRTVKYVVNEGNGLFFDHKAFARDVRLVFENCKKYNQPKTEFFKLATNFLRAFEKMYRDTNWEALAAAEKQQKAGSEDKHAVEGSVKQDASQGPQQSAGPKQNQFMNGQQANSAGVEQKTLESLKDITKMMNTSSVSSDDQDDQGELKFAFVSTEGMEKKRGRKSSIIMALEEKHRMLMRQRKVIRDSMDELERRKQNPPTFEEKAQMCEDVANLDFVRMRSVVEIIVKGINRPDIYDQEEVELDIDVLDRRTFRNVQVYLENPTLVAAHGTLKAVEGEIANLESQIVQIRYRKAGTATA